MIIGGRKVPGAFFVESYNAGVLSPGGLDVHIRGIECFEELEEEVVIHALLQARGHA